jgi:hypothetical protein
MSVSRAHKCNEKSIFSSLSAPQAHELQDKQSVFYSVCVEIELDLARFGRTNSIKGSPGSPSKYSGHVKDASAKAIVGLEL